MDVMSHTEPTITQEAKALKVQNVETQDMEPEPEGQLELSLEENETLDVAVSDARLPEQEERQVEEKKALVLAEIEKDPSNFWSWHALSCLFASNDDVTGAIEVGL